MKKQSSTGVTGTALVPQVRYHPSIKTKGAGDGLGGDARSRRGPLQAKPGPAHTGPEHQQVPQRQAAGPGPAARPCLHSRTHRPVKLVEGAAADPDLDPAPDPHPDPDLDPAPDPALDPAPYPDLDLAPDPAPDLGVAPDPDPAPHPDLDPDPDPAPGQTAGPAPQRKPARLQPVPVVLGEQLDEGLVKDVEVLTRGQRTNKHWFAWRRNRITASLAPSIAQCCFVNDRSSTLPSSYLAAIKGEAPRYQTRSMSWGVANEEMAVLRYQELKSALLGHQVKVEACGLFIDPQRPWLAASPDGLVRDGPDQWLLEVKCPFKHKDKRVEEACRQDKDFCLEGEPQQPAGSLSYSLKTSHRYFTQVQCQLAVTGLQRADFVVFTREETVIVPVTFDPERWKDTLSKLEKFYVEAYPHLEKQAQAAAAMNEL